MVLAGALMFLFWGGIIGLVVWGIMRLTRHSEKRNGAFEIVRQRYAKGEINKEEFDRIKRDL
jgi:putative membrane protein